MIKTQYTIDETLAAMEANATLQILVASERGKYQSWSERLTDEGARMEVLRFHHQLQATWHHLTTEVKNEMGRARFYQEAFEKYVDFSEVELSLSASIHAIAERMRRDFGRGEYPFGDGSEFPVYLTSGCCEVTEQYDDLLDQNGLEYGSFEGRFFPLTDEEAKFIADDVAEVDDGYGALMGYSALYRGEKYLMPSIEISFEANNAMSRDLSLKMAYEFVTQHSSSIEETGGHIIVDADCDIDRHVIQVLIPCSYAAAVADDYNGWKSHLEEVLLPNTLEAKSSPSA